VLVVGLDLVGMLTTIVGSNLQANANNAVNSDNANNANNANNENNANNANNAVNTDPYTV
jgi:hypothetical protein